MAEIAGLKLIVPSSVAGSGVSVSASGKVTFTAATSVSVNGVFNSTYDNYLMVCRLTTSAASNINFQGRMRASGSDNSTSNSYVGQRITASSTSVTGARITNTFTYLTSPSGATPDANGFHLYLYGPYLAQPTAGRTVSALCGTGAEIEDFAFTHNQSTAYDGFTFYAASDNISGACTFYGLLQ